MRMKGVRGCEVAEAFPYPQFLAPALSHRRSHSVVKERLRLMEVAFENKLRRLYTYYAS